MSDPVFSSAADVEPLLSGTLVLMTAAQSPSACEHLPAKIGSNLDRLSAHPTLSGEFRMVLARLRQHWSSRCACGRATASADAHLRPPVGGRLLH